MLRVPWVIAVAAFCCFLSGAEAPSGERETAKEALKAYAAMDYFRAAQLAKTIPNTPEGRLVAGLCDLYDRSRMNIKRGQLILAELFYSQSEAQEFRVEAGVALGRTVQLMKERRELYGNAADRYDHVKIFEEILQMAPGSAAAASVMLFLSRERLEDPAQQEAAFEAMEKFISDFRGDPKLLTTLHLLAEYEYIRLKRDYKSAIRHLEAGYRAGFSNPSEDRSALFKIGYFYYKHLDDKENAVKYLREYLKRYAYSNQAVVAQRFLTELGEKI